MGYINEFRAKLTELIEEGSNGAGLIDKADPAEVRKAERFEKRTKHNVPPRR